MRTEIYFICKLAIFFSFFTVSQSIYAEKPKNESTVLDVDTAHGLRQYCANRRMNNAFDLKCYFFVKGVLAGHQWGAMTGAFQGATYTAVNTGDQNTLSPKFFDSLTKKMIDIGATTGYCPGSATPSYDVLIDIFVNYMDVHPERVNEPSYIVFMDSLQGTFPCVWSKHK